MLINYFVNVYLLIKSNKNVWIRSQLTNFALTLRSNVKFFLDVGSINSPFDRCFSSAAVLNEGPFRAKLIFEAKSQFLLNMYENAKLEPFPNVAGHILRSIFKEKKLSQIKARLDSNDPITMVHDVIVEVIPAIGQSFALEGAGIDVESLGARFLIRTLCLLTFPTLFQTWKVLNVVEKEKFKNNFFVRRQIKDNQDDPSEPVYMLKEYVSLKANDGSQVTVVVDVFAGGTFYGSKMNELFNNKVILDFGVPLPQQGIVNLPVYFSYDSGITIERVSQPDVFINRPEVINQLKWLKETESAAIFVGPESQKLIKFNEKAKTPNFVSNENASALTTKSSSQNFAEEFSLIDSIESTLTNN